MNFLDFSCIKNYNEHKITGEGGYAGDHTGKLS